jgi:hypothetical protein
MRSWRVLVDSWLCLRMSSRPADPGEVSAGMLPYVWQVTKYDPADRDEHGRYLGPETIFSDHGPIEQAYLDAVAAFCEDAGSPAWRSATPRSPGRSASASSRRSPGTAWPGCSHRTWTATTTAPK